MSLSIPSGFRASSVSSGIKPSGGLDLAVIAADRPCSAAGVFTLNRIAAAPVKWDRAIVASDSVRAVVINAGNANAATGAQGFANARRTAELAAAHFGCQPESVLVASTGVIGRQLPMDRLESGLAIALGQLSPEPPAFEQASRAIMTTDTQPKILCREIAVDGGRATLLGICKGAAMIGPRMATMLAFLFTDARVAPEVLDACLRKAVDASFHCVTVEGHTSTNDTVLLLASNASDRPAISSAADIERFSAVVSEVCIELARMIADDAEGASHRITIDVEGCRTLAEARVIARSVAEDALVKTAIHGADPNWGRIVSAVGHSGVDFEEADLSLWVNGHKLYQAGSPLPFDEAEVSRDLREHRETAVRLVLTLGDARVRFWTCDLTADYVRLNADYTT